MKTDRFWPTFWLVFGAMVLGCLGVSGTLFFAHIGRVDAAALGIFFDPDRDPFDVETRSGNLALKGGVIYQEALPLGFNQWAWDATLDWSSADQHYAGGRSLKITFKKNWAGMGVSGFTARADAYKTLSFAVKPDAAVGDLYVQVYDERDDTLALQSMSWYAPDGALVPGQWNYLAIPLANLVGSSTPSTITGITISTTHPGVAYVDDVQLSTTVVAHDPWVPPQNLELPPYNPFATSTPLSLPYALALTPSEVGQWYSYRGHFELAQKGLQVGPSAGGNTDALAVLKGGRSWDNYQVDTVVDWGPSQTFSLLVRFADEQNFVSCAYGGYGQTVTLYDVHDGVSTALGVSPTLAIPFYEAWSQVSMTARVAGDRVTCLVRGIEALSMKIPDIPNVGTVGMEVWDQNSYSQPHTVKALSVRPLVGE